MSNFGFAFANGEHMMFSLLPLLSNLVFLVIIGVFVAILVRGISGWHKNNRSPVLTVAAEIVARRGDVTHHHRSGEMHHSSSSTTYYVTFQVESGDRLELQVGGAEYGQLLEGDRGTLSFQGARYLGFTRTRADAAQS